jgi:hypothetical protein
MSPFSTFHNVGSSSRLVDLSHTPKRVSRSSSVATRASSEWNSAWAAGSLMVRYFTSSKISSFLPGLLCLKRTGEPRFFLTRPAMTSWMGAVSTGSTPETVKSTRRLSGSYIVSAMARPPNSMTRGPRPCKPPYGRVLDRTHGSIEAFGCLRKLPMSPMPAMGGRGWSGWTRQCRREPAARPARGRT